MYWYVDFFQQSCKLTAKDEATLIPKELTDSFELVETKADEDGRFLLVNCKICDI